MLRILIIVCHILSVGIFYRPSLNHIKTTVKNSEDMEWYLTYFRQKKDKVELDEWKTPEEFYNTGGDCEDYAVLVYEVLSSIGYDCSIYGLYDKTNNGHAVVVYNNGTDYGHFSNYKRYKGETSIKEILIDYDFEYYKEYNWKKRRKYLRR